MKSPTPHIRRKPTAALVLLILAFPAIPCLSTAGTYTGTAHGSYTLRTGPNSGADRDIVNTDNIRTTYGYAVANCFNCHEQHGQIEGSEPTPNAGAAAGPDEFALFQDNYGANTNALCYACHDNIPSGAQWTAGEGRYGFYTGGTDYGNSAHGSDADVSWPTGTDPVPPGPAKVDVNNCNNCHNPHGYDDGTSDVNPLPSMLHKRESDLCLVCHDGNTAGMDIETLVTTAGYTRHNVGAYTDIHDQSESQFTTMHVECVDCHNPHRGTNAIPVNGVSGVDPPAATAGATPTRGSYTEVTVTDAGQQYKICFKCHTNWATGSPVAGTSNVAIAFNTANDSYHWAETDKGSAPGIYSGSSANQPTGATFNHTVVTAGLEYVEVMMPGRASYTDADLRGTALRCSDCHGPTGADGEGGTSNTSPEGPHGNSSGGSMLKVPATSPYTVWNATVYIPNAGDGTDTNIWCFNCHDPLFAGTGFYRNAPNQENLHLLQHTGNADEGYCQNCHLANPHGQTGSGTTNQREHLLKPSTFTESIDDGASGRISGEYEQTPGHNVTSLGCT